MNSPRLVTITGRDRPGVTAAIAAVLQAAGAHLADVEQVVVHGQLTLCLLLGVDPGEDLATRLREAAGDLEVVVRPVPPAPATGVQLAVTLVGDRIGPGELATVAAGLAEHAGNIERIHRLSDDDLSALEILVSVPAANHDLDARLAALRQQLLGRLGGVDVAVQRERLRRRAKRLVAFDMDSTLIAMEVIDELARRRGVGDEVAAITASAMAGELDFEASLRARVARLAGLPVAELTAVAERLPLTEGAEALIGALRRLGYRTAVISGGFTFAAEALRRRLGLDYAYANTLEVAGGVLTGALREPIVTPARKADLLDAIAQGEGIDLDQTIAIGDGANDLPMLARAGLGVAFHGKPRVTLAADTAIRAGSMLRVLYLLGLRGRDVAELVGSEP